MLLTSAVILTALGFVVWGAGIVGDYTALAALGAVLVVGVGGMVLTDGLERTNGEVREVVGNDQTVVTPQTTEINLLPQTPTGAVWMLIGAVMFMHGVNPND